MPPVLASSNNPQLLSPLSHETPAPRPSLSESALPLRRVALHTSNNAIANTNTSANINNNNSNITPQTIRPVRFVKPSIVTTTSSTSTTSTSTGTLTTSNAVPHTAINSTHHKNGMDSFISLFESYSQKVYMEGYLMQQDKKYFVELCGSTLSLWDTSRPGAVVTPDYIPIIVDTKVQATSLRQQFSLETNKKKTLVFDTLDPASLTKWICAIRLACFERQLLHQYFTLRLLTPSDLSSTQCSSTGYLQVLVNNNKNEWKKLWVVIMDNGTSSKLSKYLGKQDPAVSSSSASLPAAQGPRLVLLENKKSKSPLFVLNRVDHAYAVYPEAPSLIGQSTLIRLEGVQTDNHPMDILLMADSNAHMIQWLFTLYNAFKLYGRPQALVQDPMNPVALNFGERVLSKANSNWWLETEDVLPDMDIFVPMERSDIHQLLTNTLHQKQLSPSSSSQISYPQQRANSLPLITVEAIDSQRQRATSDAGILNETGLRSALHSQVADSSDESDDNADDDDDDDFDDEPDSDDEPIGKSKSAAASRQSSQKNNDNGSSLLIPDFDFGNVFDTDRRASSNSSLLLYTGSSSTLSGSMTSRPSSRQQQQKLGQRQQHSSSSGSCTSTSSSSGNSDTVNTKKPSPSSLFGDFSLRTDFNKYLDPTVPPRVSTPDRKYSLPANTKLYSSPVSNNSSGFSRRRSSWEHRDDSIPGDDYGNWHDRSPRSRYLDEDYIYHDGDDEDEDDDDKAPGDDDDQGTDDYDQDGPLIPSLNDHFAPRNSLLDNFAGEQLSAKEQIEYARATGQPLIQVPSKPKPPKGGLVGVISQRERNRRQGNGTRVAERVHQHNADRLEREKERRILEQRQQQYLKHQIMMYAANGYVYPMMMHPYVTPNSPGSPMSPLPPMMSPGSPYSSGSPVTPTNPMPSPANGYIYGRPYSPSGNSYTSNGKANNMMCPGSPSSPHQPFINLSGGSSQCGSVGRRHSRPLLSEEEEEDEPLYSPYMAQYQQQQQQQQSPYPCMISPPYYRNMQPAPSSSTGSSSVRL